MALTVRDVMVTDLVTVRPGATAREAYRLMRDRRFRHLPVLQDGRLVGILSQSTGLDVSVSGGADAYERIVDIVRRHDARIISVGAVPAAAGRTVFSVRLEPTDPRPIVAALREARFEVLTR